MKLYSLRATQLLPTTLSEAWAFLSSPKNLSAITPADLHFKVTSSPPDVMHAGMIITYTVTPLLGIPIPWVTEITHVQEPSYFVDEQRFGPYRFWHHQHTLKEVENGVQSEDIVHYGLWITPFDRILDKLIVRPMLDKIFAYRREALAKKFPK